MSARLEALLEQLESIKTQIADRAAVGQPTDDLLEQERSIAKQLTKARGLLTENTSVLKG
jgi:flagellar hook-associated protein FlgK